MGESEDDKNLDARGILSAIDELDTVPWDEVPTRIADVEGEITDSTVAAALRAHYLLPPEDDPLAPGTEIGGRYRIIEPLGSGGMGAVYLADQYRVDRKVALKTIRPAMATSEALAHRMAGEISSLGRLDHPFIVRIFDADVFEDEAAGGRQTLYFTMEAVEGETLNSWRESGYENGGRSLDDILECFSKICEAVAFAHERGVIHRDLKPGNILVRSDGSPAIVDFGISSVGRVGATSSEREDREALTGTPGYMSPQKWQFKDDLEAGDVFALGIVLYELVAGRYPWDLPPKPSVDDFRKSAIEGSTRPMRSAVPDAGPAVSRLAGRLLEADATARPSAEEAYGFVRAILKRRRRRRWAKRWAPAIAIMVFSLCGLAWLFGRDLWIKNKRLKSEAAHQDVVAYLLQPGGDPAAFVMQKLPSNAVTRHDDGAWKSAVIRAHTHWTLRPEPTAGTGEGMRHIATDSALAARLVGYRDGSTALLRGGESDLLPVPAGFPAEPVDHAVFGPKGVRIAAKMQSGNIFVWNLDSGVSLHLTTVTHESRAIAFSPDGTLLACGSTEGYTSPSGRVKSRGVVKVWEAGRWDKESYVLRSKRSGTVSAGASPPICRSVEQVAWSPDSKFLATVGHDSLNVFVWDCRTGAPRDSPRQSFYHQATVSSIAWSPQSLMPLLATGRTDGVISIWDDGESTNRTEPSILCGAASLTGQASLSGGSSGDQSSVESVAWLPGAAEVLAIHRSGEVLAWPLSDPTRPGRRFSLDQEIDRAGWHAGAEALSVSSRNKSEEGSHQIWRWVPGRLSADIFVPIQLNSMSFHPSEPLLAVGGPVAGAVINIERIEVRSRVRRNLSGSVRFDPSGSGLWYFSRDRGLLFVDDEGEETRVWDDDQIYSGALAFSAEGDFMVYSKGTDVFALERRSAANGARVDPAFRLDDANAVSFSANRDGRWIAVNWGMGLRSEIYRMEDSGVWAEVGLPATMGRGITKFGSDGTTAITLLGELLGRRAIGATGPAKWFRLPAPVGMGRAESPLRLVLASRADLAIADAVRRAPLVLRLDDDRPRLIAELDRGANEPRSSIATSSDGRVAATASSCWRGSLVTIWDLAELRRVLLDTGFEPVNLERAEIGN